MTSCTLNNANRIYFANYQVGIKPQCLVSFVSGNTDYPNDPPDYDFNDAAYHVKGLQSITSNTTFNNRQVFQICQSEIYENVEDIPDVELTLAKVLDGCCLLYHLVTGDATEPTLQGRANASASLAISIFEDTVASTGYGGSTPQSTVVFPNLFINSLSYTFDVENDFTEEITLVGNDKLWWYDPAIDDDLEPCAGNPCASGQAPPASGALGAAAAQYCQEYIDAVCGIDFPGMCEDNDCTPCVCPEEQSGVQNTKDFMVPSETDLASPPVSLDINGLWCEEDVTILPSDIPGVDCYGRIVTAIVQNISVSTDLNREEFKALGSRQVKFRAIDFPVEVTTEIEVIATVGDLVPHTAEGIYNCGTCFSDPEEQDRCEGAGTNLLNQTVRIATCGGLRLYTGTKNKLQSVNVTGGDAGGDNVTITYTYTTFNTLTVMHKNDCNAVTAALWGTRATYLCDAAP